MSSPDNGIGEEPVSSMGMTMSVTFNSSGSCTVYYADIDDETVDSGTYSISGKTLTQRMGNTTFIWQIISMTNSKAVFGAGEGLVWTFKG